MTTTDDTPILAYAAQLDAEPCRCVETDRGTDTYGCLIHATEEE